VVLSFCALVFSYPDNLPSSVSKPLTKKIMSNKTRSILKAVAVVVVLLCVLMKLGIIAIPALSAYTFWMVVVAFGLMLIASR
jgi:hypothetical protein